MERRAGSHTEEEELNQRRRLLNSARKGDPKAISKLFELYQVRVYTGEVLGKGRIPDWPKVPKVHGKVAKGAARSRSTRKKSHKAARSAKPRRRGRATRKLARSRRHR